MKVINIEELLEPLGFIDLRAVRTWCQTNKVLIVKQGKNEFVFQSEFKLAFELPFINQLKLRHGNDWERHYRFHEEGNIPELIALNEALSSGAPIIKDVRKTNGFYDRILKDFNDEKKVA